MQKTDIDWADMSWNPVTGCLHGCPYCYARRIARRFKGFEVRCGGEEISDENKPYSKNSIWNNTHGENLHVFHGQPMRRTKSGKFIKATFPYDFSPTLHRYRMGEPAKTKEPQSVFVCSMADLFGNWVPTEWIEEVFAACAAAPQHRYLFLTKNPSRYTELAERGMLPNGSNYWFGSTATTQECPFWWSDGHNTFVSIEPIHGPFDRVDNPVKKVDWVIIGAESGQRKDKVAPEREWIDNIVENCRTTGTAVFMKESLRVLMGDNFVQEYPWEVKPCT